MKKLKHSILILAIALLLAGVMHQFGHDNYVEEANSEIIHFEKDCVLTNLADATDLAPPYLISIFTSQSVEHATTQYGVYASTLHFVLARGPPSFYKS